MENQNNHADQSRPQAGESENSCQDTQVRGIIIPCKASGTPDYIEHAKKMLEVFKFHLSTLESELLEPQPKRKKYR